MILLRTRVESERVVVICIHTAHARFGRRPASRRSARSLWAPRRPRVGFHQRVAAAKAEARVPAVRALAAHAAHDALGGGRELLLVGPGRVRDERLRGLCQCRDRGVQGDVVADVDLRARRLDRRVEDEVDVPLPEFCLFRPFISLRLQLFGLILSPVLISTQDLEV